MTRALATATRREAGMADPVRSQDPASLASEVLRLSGDLIRKEVALAKTEIRQSIRRTCTALGLIVAAAVIGIVTLNILAAALVAALAQTELGLIWSALITGAVLALLTGFLLLKGIRGLKSEAFMPSRTMQNVQHDARAIREAYRDK